MFDTRVYGLLLAFYCGSWLSNGHIIRTTTALLETASLSLILAASSLAGLSFFVVLRALGRFQRPMLAGWLMLPVWGMLQLSPMAFPEHPLIAALIALLFGEMVKWHLYTQVLLNWGPMGAQRILGLSVLCYELGTVTAALFPTSIGLYEVMALVPLFGPFLMKRTEEVEMPLLSQPRPNGPWNEVLPWIVGCGMVAGFLKVSADTGFKYAIKLHEGDALALVSHFYLVSAVITLGLGVMRRVKWLAPRLGCTQASFMALGISQVVFAFAVLLGNAPLLVGATALQRSIDKIFYQPTMQLLTSGFNSTVQEKLRRWHVIGFLGIGSFLGLIAFSAHGLLSNAHEVLWGISLVHAVFAGAFFWVGAKLVGVTISALDEVTRLAGPIGGSRPMAMLALLSPRHFLVHALMWSNRHGGKMHALPDDLMQGLVAEQGQEVVRTFYRAFPHLEETQQLALIRLAAFMDRSADREFLMNVALDEHLGTRKARRVAAHHLVKVLGKEARPLLRRSRGKNSPLPKKVA